MITIFTDGASRGNPGPGGWGAVVVDGDHVREFGGGESGTTNNRMELMAAIGGLSAVADDSEARVYSDSRYIINGITKWVAGWKRNGWKTQAKEDVLNRDLWEKLAMLTETRAVSWEYVGGHVGVRGNERCDEIATAFADGEDAGLYYGPLSGYKIKDVLDVSHDQSLVADKKTASSRSGAKAYSYVSKVGGIVEVHKTWAECEKRVKGAKGARYKKALTPSEEAELTKSL